MLLPFKIIKVGRNNKMKKQLNWFYLSACMLVSTTLTAAENQINENNSTAFKLGTPASFLNGLGVNAASKKTFSPNSANASVLESNASTKFSLVNNIGDEITVITDDLSLASDGSLSMTGKAVNHPNSKFIMQGDEENVYGWVILEDQDVAYEYTTQEGQLFVNEIKVTDVHPNCDFEDHNHSVYAPAKGQAAQAASNSHIGQYDGSHVGQLESNPGSNYVILLDTRRIMSNGVPYDVSKEFIWTTWQIVAASFSMLDVNVTTNWDVYNAAAVSRRGGATMYRETGRSTCHYAFGTSTFCTLHRESDAYGQGRIAAHELGHLLHLAHDGGYPGGEYYNGISDFQWVPIMGNIWMATSWGEAVYQWSKGEYSGASNRENDFSIINSFIPFKSDDIPSSKALIIGANGSVSGTSNTGQIERNTDSDKFTFTIGGSGGVVNLNIDRTEHIGGGMLDVQAYIRNSAGTVVAQSNHNVSRSASFNQNLAAGSYTLEITGGAEGTPNWGFSKYSSLGHYAIAGFIGGDIIIDPIDTPSIDNLKNGDTLSGPSQSFTWNDGGAEGFWFYAGSSAGAQDYYRNDSQINGTSHTVTGLPTDGSAVYVTFHYLADGEWSQVEYNFTAFNDDNSGQLGITSPTDGQTLTSSSQVFTWNEGNAEGFWFYAGSSAGAKDYYRNDSQINDTAHTVTGLPTDGSTVYITFHYLMDGQWSQLNYSYIAFNDDSICNAEPATPNKSINTADSATSFTADWELVSGATAYTVQLWQDEAWQTIDTTSQSEFSFTGLLANSTQYVHVMASNSCGDSGYSAWTEITLSGDDECTSAPEIPTGLAGTNQLISWNAVSGATSYDLQYWTGTWTNLGSSTDTSYSSGLSGRQYVRASATNNCGSSNYSDYVTIN